MDVGILKGNGMKLLLSGISDVYRLGAAIFDWRTNWRIVTGRAQLDVACITNFETSHQKSFIGLASRHYANGLRYSIKGILGRYILINSDARGMMQTRGRSIAKQQLKDAIAYSSSKGARVILFAAATKRLLAEKELTEIQQQYPHITFTIGDNGTVLLLLSDIKHTIKRYNVEKKSGILLIGPNGFLGSTVKKHLEKEGYETVYTASYRDEKPFEHIQNVRLIIACSHHNKLRLKQVVLKRIGSPKGVVVVDVCKPDNLSDAEYRKCIDAGQTLVKIRSGTVFNQGLNYMFGMAAKFVLEQLSLKPKMLYACFGEATLLAQVSLAKTASDANSHRQFDFMDTNTPAMDYISAGFAKAEYALVSRVLRNRKYANIEIRHLDEKINLIRKRNVR